MFPAISIMTYKIYRWVCPLCGYIKESKERFEVEFDVCPACHNGNWSYKLEKLDKPESKGGVGT
jgi:Zn-finger nucleic acid-binding protein